MGKDGQRGLGVPGTAIAHPPGSHRDCPEGLLGADRPTELMGEAIAAMPVSVKRLVVVLRSDSDPRFLQAEVFPVLQRLAPLRITYYEVAYAFGAGPQFGYDGG